MIWPRTKTGNECFDNSTFPKKFLKAVVKIPTTMPFEINCEGMDFTHPTISEDPHFPKGSVKDPFSLSSQDTTNRKIKREEKEEKKKVSVQNRGKGHCSKQIFSSLYCGFQVQLHIF